MSSRGTGPGELSLGHVPGGDGHHRRRHRQVDEEHQPPAVWHRADQQPAEERARRGGHAAKTGPGADRGPAVVLGEGRLQDGQAARGQQRPADALQGPRRDEHRDVRGQPAQQRRDREPDGADHEHLPPPVAVPERPAEQQQPGQGQRVGVHHPLQAGHAGVEIPPDSRQGDAHHGRVDGGHARAEHGGGHHPPALRAGQPQAGAPRIRYGSLAHVPFPRGNPQIMTVACTPDRSGSIRT